MLIQVIGAFFSVVAFSFLLHVPRKYIIWAGFTGAVGWWIYLFLIGINLSVAFCSIANITHLIFRILSNTPTSQFGFESQVDQISPEIKPLQ